MALSRITNPFLSSSGSGNASITSPAANTIAFSTTTTERMRLDSSGNLGIGTTAPAFALHVKGSDYRSGIFETTSNLGPSVQIKGSKTYELRSTNTGATEGAGLFFIYDKDNEASRLTINSGGVIAVKFAATQVASADANTLDDYEEGTWTPTITSSSGTITSYTSTGYYVKIGKQVTVWCNVKITNVGTGTGSVSIASMPFTVNATDLFGIVAVGRETDITGSVWQGWTTSGGNGFNLLRYDNAGLIGTNYRYVGSVTYTV